MQSIKHTTAYTRSKKSPKIPKAQPESPTNRRTDNTMAKRKWTIYKTLHRKLKIELHEPH
jgi:hypothetical protein